MLFSMFTIKDTIKKIDALNSQIKENIKKEDLEVFKHKFYAIGYDLALALNEAYITLEDYKLGMLYNNTITRIQSIVNTTSSKEMKNILNDIIYDFKDYKYNDYKIYSINNRAKTYHNNKNYDLEDQFALNELIKKIKCNSNRDINVFHLDCNDGQVSQAFNVISDKVKLYGNEANGSYLREAKKVMHKAVKGIIRGSRIQNNAFDIVYAEPVISYKINEDNLLENKRPEKMYIMDIFKYARQDGLVIVTMPHTRLYKDICTMFAKHLKNIHVIKAGLKEFNSFGLIHIIGQKDTAKYPRDNEYSKLRQLCNMSIIKDINSLSLIDDYVLPNNNILIELFKGSALDLEELNDLMTKSNLMNKIWDGQKVDKTGENIKNPLLPFNIGQLGLVLTSGCLDGVVDEGDNNYHLIKGRVSKYTQKVEIEKDGKIELTETTVNKVEINVLLPNGEYKVLA